MTATHKNRGRRRQAFYRAMVMVFAFACLSSAAQNVDGISMLAYPPYSNPILSMFGYGPSEQIILVALKPGAGLRGAGMAVDEAGNIYLSDYGSDTNSVDGRIVMIEKEGRKPITIMRKLDRPSDIEMAPDQRSLVIAMPDGKIAHRYFGVTVRVRFAGEPARNPVVFMKTDTATYASTMNADGYFHFPQALAPPQQKFTVNLIIQNGSKTHVKANQFLSTTGARLVGESVIEVTVP